MNELQEVHSLLNSVGTALSEAEIALQVVRSKWHEASLKLKIVDLKLQNPIVISNWGAGRGQDPQFDPTTAMKGAGAATQEELARDLGFEHRGEPDAD